MVFPSLDVNRLNIECGDRVRAARAYARRNGTPD